MPDPLAPVPAVGPSGPVPKQKAPAPNADVEGVRQYLNSIGSAGDSYADSYYKAIQQGGASAERANYTLPQFIQKAWGNHNTTGKGNVNGLPRPVAPKVTPTDAGLVRTEQSAPPAVSTSSPDHQGLNPFQTAKTKQGEELGGIPAFIDGIKKNTWPRLVMSAGKLAQAAVETFVSPLAFGMEMVPATQAAGKAMREAVDSSRAGNDDFLAKMQTTTTSHPGQTNAPVRVDKDGNWSFGLDGTADFFSNTAIDLLPTVATGVAGKVAGMGTMARTASAWAAQTIMAAPGMYAEARQAGISPKAANVLAYTGAAVSAGIDVVTGGEAKLLGINGNVLAKISAKVLGKSASTPAGVVGQIERNAFRTALKSLSAKLGKPVTELSLEGLDNATLHTFQETVRDTKRSLLGRMVTNIPKSLLGNAGTAIEGGLGEGASATSEKAVQYAYDKFFSDNGSKAGAGQYGTDFSTSALWADVANELIAGTGVEGGMDAARTGLNGDYFKQANVMSAYAAMEATVRKTGDAGSMVNIFHDRINQQEQSGALDPDTADKVKANITRMGEVATALASVPNLSAKNKFDLFQISDKHLAPTGTQAMIAQQIAQTAEAIDSIDRQIPFYQRYPERVAELNAQKQALLDSLGEPSIEAAQTILGRRQNFLENVQNQIVSGKPAYGSLENGLEAINNFREGDIVRGLIRSATTGTPAVRVRKIQSISPDGQTATFDGGTTGDLNAISDKAIHETTRAEKQEYYEKVKRYESRTANQNNSQTVPSGSVSNYGTTDAGNANVDGSSTQITDTANEGAFDGQDEGWRNRVSRSTTNPFGTVISVNPAPDNAFTFFDNWANPRTIEQQERHFKGKTMLMNFAAGEDFARFDGYDAEGDVMLTGLGGESYTVKPKTLFGEDGLFAGFLDDNDVPVLQTQFDQKNFAKEDGISTESVPAPQRNTIPAELQANLGLSPEERAKLNADQAVTKELFDALNGLADPQQKLVLSNIKRIMDRIIPGDVDSFKKAQSDIKKLGELFDEFDLSEVAESLTPDIMELVEEQQKLRDEQIGNGLVQGQPENGNRQAESATGANQERKPVADDPGENQPATESDPTGGAVETEQTGTRSDQTATAQKSTRTDQRTDEAPVIKLSRNANPLDVVASYQDETGSLTPAITSVLNALYATPNPGEAAIHSSTASYETAGGQPDSAVTFSDGKVLFNLERIATFTGKQASAMKAWVAGKQLGSDPDTDLSGLAEEILAGDYTNQKFAGSLKGITNSNELVRAVLQGVQTGKLNPKTGSTGKPSQLLKKLIPSLTPYETANPEIYGALADGLVDTGNVYTVQGESTVSPQLQFSRVNPESSPKSRASTNKVVASLQKLFPATTVTYLSPDEFVALTGENQPAARVGNNIYLNEGSVNEETAIHEFGHVWEDIARTYYPALHQKLLGTLKGTKYETLVSEFYPDLTTQQARDSEMIALAIGQRGGKLLNQSKLAEFLGWFDRLFTRIAEKFGVESEGIATLKANQVFDDLARKILTDGERADFDDIAAVPDTIEPDPISESVLQFARSTRPVVSQANSNQTRAGNVVTKGINRVALAGPLPTDLPATMDRNLLGKALFSAEQKQHLLDNYYLHKDGSVTAVTTATINGKATTGIKLSKDKYLSGLIQSDKDPVMKDGVISEDPADLPVSFSDMTDLSRYYFSEKQQEAVFGTAKTPAEYYWTENDGKQRLDGHDLRNEVREAGAKQGTSRIMRTMIGGSQVIGNIVLGAFTETRNHKTFILTLGKKGSKIRQALGDKLHGQRLGRRGELSILNQNFLNEQLENNPAWTTFRGTNNANNVVKLPLENLLAGGFTINGKPETKFTLTKAEAINMAFTIKTLFDQGHVPTHFSLPAPEGSRDNQVFDLKVSKQQTLEILNNVLKEPGATELLNAWRQHTDVIKPYRDNVYYGIHGKPAPELAIRDKFYSPLVVAGSDLRRPANLGDANKEIEDASFVQGRTFSQLNYYRVQDAFEAIENHFRYVENYVELAPLGHDVSHAIGQVKNEADRAGFKDITKRIVDNLTNTVNMGAIDTKANLVLQKVAISAIKRNFYRTTLSGNPFVPLIQSTTLDALAIDGTIDAKYINHYRFLYTRLVASAYGDMLGGAGDKDTIPLLGGAKTFESRFLDEIAAEPLAAPAYARVRGTVSPDIDPVISNGSTKRFIGNIGVFRKRLGQLQDEHLSSAMKRTDVASVIIAWKAAGRKVQKEMGGVTTLEQRTRRCELFNTAVLNTHTEYSVIDRAMGVNDPASSGLPSLFVMFQAQNTKSFNRMLQAMIEVAHDPSMENRKQMWKHMAFQGLLSPGKITVYGLLGAYLRAVAKGDDEKWLNEFKAKPFQAIGLAYLRNIFGAGPGLAGSLFNTLLSHLDDKPWTDSLLDNPILELVDKTLKATADLGNNIWFKKWKNEDAMWADVTKTIEEEATDLNKLVLGIPSIFVETAKARINKAVLKQKEPAKPKRKRKEAEKFGLGDVINDETSDKFKGEDD